MKMRKTIAAASIAALAGAGAVAVAPNAFAKQGSAPDTQTTGQHMKLAQCGGKCTAKCGGKCAAKCGGKCAAKCGGKCAAKCGGKCGAKK